MGVLKLASIAGGDSSESTRVLLASGRTSSSSDQVPQPQSETFGSCDVARYLLMGSPEGAQSGRRPAEELFGALTRPAVSAQRLQSDPLGRQRALSRRPFGGMRQSFAAFQWSLREQARRPAQSASSSELGGRDLGHRRTTPKGARSHPAARPLALRSCEMRCWLAVMGSWIPCVVEQADPCAFRGGGVGARAFAGVRRGGISSIAPDIVLRGGRGGGAHGVAQGQGGKRASCDRRSSGLFERVVGESGCPRRGSLFRCPPER